MKKYIQLPKYAVWIFAFIALVAAGIVTFLVLRGSASGLVFADEFSAGPLNASNWAVKTPWNTQYTTGEAQYYDPADLTFPNGTLSIKTEKRSMSSFNYTSGMITSLPHPKFSYGYYEMRAQLPKGKGIWPAFWLTNDSTLEIDAFELLGDNPNKIYMTLHKNGSQIYQSTYTGPDFSAGYHTFAVDWQSTYVRWYIDGIKRGEYIASIPSDGLYIVANTAVGGPTSWPGPPDATTVFPQYYNIDYIRGYSQMPTATTIADTVPPTVSITAPTNGATVSGTVNVAAAATDNVGISKVEFYVDGTLKGTKTVAPYTYSLDTTALTVDTHSIAAKAYDTSSLSSQSQVSVTKSTSTLTTLPTIKILSPQNGTVLYNGKVAITVNAVDSIQISSVTYYLDDKLLSTQTFAPYSYYFNAKKVGRGTHVIKALLKDIQGRTTTDQVTVTR